MLIRGSQSTKSRLEDDGGRAGPKADFVCRRVVSWVQAPLQVSKDWTVKRVGENGQKDWAAALIQVRGLSRRD